MLNSAFAPKTTSLSAVIKWRLAAALRTAWRAAWCWYRPRVTMHRLEALDNRMLKDIGLDRSEIGSLRYGDGADRSRRVLHPNRSW